MAGTCSSPRRSPCSAYALDQLLLAAREDFEPIPPLPTAHSLLEPKPTACVGLVPKFDRLVPKMEPLVDLAPSVEVDLQEFPGSLDLKHSRLAQRWFRSIAKREGSLLGETPSMLDLAQLCCGMDDGALSSPCSIVEM